jgi:4-amino-4-deoxy-L-arabinose transferase-like glycosyltransferase
MEASPLVLATLRAIARTPLSAGNGLSLRSPVSDNAALDRSAVVASGASRDLSRLREWAVEAALLVGLGVLALVVRLPNLMQIPGFSDEVEDLYRGYLATQGQLLPLTDTSTYIGSLWDWMVAGAFWMSGFNLAAPRMLMLILGVLTVLATYLLGRAWGGQRGALVAGYLLVTAGIHIVINSHVAWANCMTPLFTTLGLWSLYVAVRGGPMAPPAALLLSGLCWGLAVQTHPIVMALGPGVGLFLLWQGRALLRTRWPYLAAGLVVLVNSNLVVYNLLTGFDSVAYARLIAADYAAYEPLTPLAYLGRLGLLAVMMLQSLGGGVDLRDSDLDALSDPALWPVSLLALGGVVWQWRRGNQLPGLVLASAVLIIPIFNAKYRLIHNARYVAPLLPIAYAAVGALVAAGYERLSRAGPTPPRGRWSLPEFAQLFLDLAAVFLVLHPLLYLRTLYDQAPRVGATNAPILQALERLKVNRQNGEVVVIDQALRGVEIWRGGGSVDHAFELALALQGVPFRFARLDNVAEMRDPRRRCRDQIVILAPRLTWLSSEIIDILDLRDLDHGRSPHAPSEYLLFGLYRLDRLPDAPSDC